MTPAGIRAHQIAQKELPFDEMLVDHCKKPLHQYPAGSHDLPEVGIVAFMKPCLTGACEQKEPSFEEVLVNHRQRTWPQSPAGSDGLPGPGTIAFMTPFLIEAPDA